MTATQVQPDFAAVKSRQQATWSSGDYAVIGTTLAITGELLCEAVDLRAGQQVHVKGLGARFSGVYFVTKSTHTVNDSGYITKFTARREAPLPGGLA